MKIASCLRDSRINAENVLVEISIGEYEDLIRGILHKNEFQRKRVRSSKSVYALLREDILRQCVIPPIVLALTKNISFDKEDDANFFSLLHDNSDHLVILDGLQRTHTILDLISDLREEGDDNSLDLVVSSFLRVEIYVGLNRLGILYRMLTLNTGQTPMSLRQQIEMLYLDYLSEPIDGVELVKESDGKVASQGHQYNFKDVIEGFNAYLNRDELPIDKADILENISSLEKLSKEDQSSELFEKYLVLLHALITRIVEECGDAEIDKDYIESKGTPFGKKAIQVFKKPQAMSGLGAAIGKMIDFEIVKGIDDISRDVNKIKIEDPQGFLEEINNSLLWLKGNSKKIGNAQRSYFAFFFREILNKESDSYLDVFEASKLALRKYQSQNM